MIGIRQNGGAVLAGNAGSKAEKTKKMTVSSYSSAKPFRHEYKSLIDAKQESILRIKAMGVMQPDPHVREDGSYLVRSVYFDDSHDVCLAENLNGADPRSKFRIRYYNSETGWISLEKKTKICGVGLKDSCRLTEEECETFLRGNVPGVAEDMSMEKKRLLTEVRLRGLTPKVIVTYERVPFNYGGGVRLTFDRRLTSSQELSRFLSGNYTERPVLSCGSSILEIKWNGVMPRHIKDMLKLEGLNWMALSKYSMCRIFHQ